VSEKKRHTHIKRARGACWSDPPGDFGEHYHDAAAVDGPAMYDTLASSLGQSSGVEGWPAGPQTGQDIDIVHPAYDTLSDSGNAAGSPQVAASLTYSQRVIYTKTTCASCDAPLDNSEQLLNIEDANLYCSRNSSTNHLPVSCGECNKKFPSLRELKTHLSESPCSYEAKQPFRCAVQGCTTTKIYVPNIINHFKWHHPEVKYSCAQCGSGFYSQKNLDQHGEATMHAAYKCRYPECASESTRIGDLHRHQLKHKRIVPRHPCPHCRKYRGNNGFKRKDHLRQHIRNYHHIDADAQDPNADGSVGHSCPFEGCDKTGLNGFETEKLMKVHLKKEHPSPYQCSYRGCDRVGTKGWMRERDMIKHMKKVHDV